MLTLNATHNIDMRDSSIGSEDMPITIVLNAAANNSGAGTVSIWHSGLDSSGGDITIGGGSTAVGPNISSPRTGAVARNDDEAGGLDLRLQHRCWPRHGAHHRPERGDQAETYGVQLSVGALGSTQLTAGDIDIYGWVDSNAAFKRSGVLIDSLAFLYATNSINITGVANSTVHQIGDVAPVGVEVRGVVTLQDESTFPTNPEGRFSRAQPNEQPIPAPGLTITGTTNDGPRTGQTPVRTGVLVADGEVYNYNHSPVTITGVDLSANNDLAVNLSSGSIDFTYASSATISGNTRVLLSNTIYTPFDGSLLVHAGHTLTLSEADLQGGTTGATFEAAR